MERIEGSILIMKNLSVPSYKFSIELQGRQCVALGNMESNQVTGGDRVGLGGYKPCQWPVIKQQICLVAMFCLRKCEWCV